MSDDILSLSAAELLAHYRRRSLSPVEVTRVALDRIQALQPIYNAFVLVMEEEALSAARASEARWMREAPLGRVDGLPTTIKDLLLVKGYPTRRGSLTVDPDQQWDEDSASVARMREQGAIFLGKTTTSEFGWKGVTDSPLSGVTGNPWNPALTPGGSSGGAAVAAALGMGVMHVATDGGGSIRIPSAFCGLFGFKPTFGVVPVHPHPPAGTLWHQGPIARTVHDAALMLSVIAEPDARDFYAGAASGIDYREDLDQGIGDMRIAYSRTLGYARVDAEVAELVDRGARELERLGAHVEEIDFAMSDPIDIMAPLWSVALAMGVQPMTSAQRALVDPPLLDLAEPGFHLSALEYRTLEKRREALAQRMSALHQRYDLMITPQLATTAFATLLEVPPESELKRWWQWSPFTYPFNLTQQPAATMPCGFASNGLPVAMQLVGARFADRKVLRAARAYERMHPIRTPALPKTAAAVQ
ncbi:MAG: amidase [Burkholderiales bacterium]|nr:amidase [Burkholderiales bacterium]